MRPESRPLGLSYPGLFTEIGRIGCVRLKTL
jgi:hypothetical protein